MQLQSSINGVYGNQPAFSAIQYAARPVTPVKTASLSLDRFETQPIRFGTLKSPETHSLETAGIQYYLGGAEDMNIENPTFSTADYSKSQRLEKPVIEKFLTGVQSAQSEIRRLYTQTPTPNSMGWLSSTVIEKEKARAKAIKNYVEEKWINHSNGSETIKDVIIVAMGGNVGTMKLAATSVAKQVDGNTITAKNDVKFHFIDTMEPNRIHAMRELVRTQPDNTLLCLVSQSGTTAETIAINALLQSGQPLPKENVIPMIGKSDSAIGGMAKNLGYTKHSNVSDWSEDNGNLFAIPSWEQTGGRWTGNTAEPSLVIALGGGDPKAWFEGYQSVITDFLTKPNDENAVLQSALLDVAYSFKGFRDFYTFAYSDKLAGAGHALTQNVNESTPSLEISKQPFGNGLIHKFLVAPAAQHADMATLTDFAHYPIKLRVLMVNDADSAGDTAIDFATLFGTQTQPETFKESTAASMDKFKPSQLMNAMAAATAFDAWKRGRPVEFVTLPDISETTMGALMAEQYLRTMVWGQVNNVDVTREMSFPDYKGVFGGIVKRGVGQANQAATQMFYDAAANA